MCNNNVKYDVKSKIYVWDTDVSFSISLVTYMLNWTRKWVVWLTGYKFEFLFSKQVLMKYAISSKFWCLFEWITTGILLFFFDLINDQTDDLQTALC